MEYGGVHVVRSNRYSKWNATSSSHQTPFRNRVLVKLKSKAPNFDLRKLRFGSVSCCSAVCRTIWRWAFQATSYYLFFLCLVVKAQDYASPSSSSSSVTYPCENVGEYYSHVGPHPRGKQLQKKLFSIIHKHRSVSYKQGWDAIKLLDAADVDQPEPSSAVVEIYSLRVVSKDLAGRPDGWNREHLWPRSYGLSGPSFSDLHNIRPADVHVNSSRSNKYYGQCSSYKDAKCLKPANKEAASDTETDKERWAPPMQVRGDIARAVMYMAVCYGYGGGGGGGGSHLRLSDTPSIGRREMGMLSALLEWNEIDPPSREEKLRNERVCKLYQHNRNPFVDHPEFAHLIWKK